MVGGHGSVPCHNEVSGGTDDAFYTVSRQQCERQKCERHQCEARSANANSAKRQQCE